MEQAKIKGGSVKVRMTPSSDGTVLMTLPEGTPVTIESRKNDVWWMIGYKGKTGFVMKSLLAAFDPKADVVAATITLPIDVIKEIYKACEVTLKRRGELK